MSKQEDRIERKRARDRAYYQAHRDEILNRYKQWIKEHPEKRREYERRYRLRNPDKALAKNRRKVRRWRLRHPELNRERSRIYNQTYRNKQHGNKKQARVLDQPRKNQS